MADIELKPCPFCGHSASLFVSNGVRVLCPKCRAQSKILTDAIIGGKVAGNATKAVIKAWNRRVEYIEREMDGNDKDNDWIEVRAKKPPENQIVQTKIDDISGVRNESELIYSKNHWWLPDKSMYVYYTPTHWKELSSSIAKMDGEDSEQNESMAKNQRA